MVSEKHFLNKAEGEEQSDTLMMEKFKKARMEKEKGVNKKKRIRIKEIDMGLKPIEERTPEETDLKPREKPVKVAKTSFLNALNQKLTEMQNSGRISLEQAEEKRKSAASIETGLSEDPEHDAEVFALSGIAKEEEMIKTFKKRFRKERAPKEGTSSWKEYNLEHLREEIEIAKKRGDKEITDYYKSLLEKTESKKPEKKTERKFKKGMIRSTELAADIAESHPGYNIPDDAREEGLKIKNIKAKGRKDAELVKKWLEENPETSKKEGLGQKEVPSEAEIEPRQLSDEEAGVLARRLLERENLSGLNDEKKEWLLKALKNDLKLKIYAIKKLDELSEKDMDFLRGTNVKSLLDTARHPGFSAEKESSEQLGKEGGVPKGAPKKEKPRKPAEEELTWEEILRKSRKKEKSSDEEMVKSGITKEKGPGPKEVLGEKRSELAREYAKLKEKRLGVFGSEKIEDTEEARKIALLERDYRDALKDYRDDLLDKDPKKYKEILLMTVAEEAEKFYGLKMDFRYEAKKGDKFERIKKMAGNAVERYRKIKPRYKYLLAGALFATGAGAGYLGGAAGWALATGAVSGRWFQRVFGGAAAGVGLEAKIKTSQERKERKEVLKKFEKQVLFLSEQKNVELDKKLFELEGGKKKKKIGRFMLAGTAGALIMSGMVGQAIRNISGLLDGSEGAEIESVFGKIKNWFNFDEKPTAVETTGEISPKPSIGSPEAATEARFKIPETVKVAEGDSIWKISERYLEEKGDLKGLSSEQRIYAIDALKDRIAEGMENPDALESGQEIEFGTKFNPEDIDKFVEDAKGLSPEQMENIAGYQGESVEAPSRDGTGNGVEVGWEKIRTEISSVFGGDVFGGDSGIVERADGVKVIKNAYGQKGFDLLFTGDKVGVDGPMGWNIGSKGKFLGFGDRMPTDNLNSGAIEKVKKFILESAKKLQ